MQNVASGWRYTLAFKRSLSLSLHPKHPKNGLGSPLSPTQRPTLSHHHQHQDQLQQTVEQRHKQSNKNKKNYYQS